MTALFLYGQACGKVNIMNTLKNDLQKTGKIYRELFLKASQAIDAKLYALKKNSLCNHCTKNCVIDPENLDLFTKLPPECGMRFWQEAAKNLLEDGISKDILEKINEINAKRGDSHCSMCASCCNLASSEFSYEELKQKAQNGDKFAAEFVSIFLPYESAEEAAKIYPDYIALIKEQFPEDKKISFYHCPKVGSDNLCTDYENRPQICRDFPSNPLVVFPPKCSYRKWKDEVEITALLLHAMVEIVGFYKEKLNEALG